MIGSNVMWREEERRGWCDEDVDVFDELIDGMSMLWRKVKRLKRS